MPNQRQYHIKHKNPANKLSIIIVPKCFEVPVGNSLFAFKVLLGVFNLIIIAQEQNRYRCVDELKDRDGYIHNECFIIFRWLAGKSTKIVN